MDWINNSVLWCKCRVGVLCIPCAYSILAFTLHILAATLNPTWNLEPTIPVCLVATIKCNTGPVAMHNTVFGPCRLQVLKLLYIVCFSVLVFNSANVAMCNARCPVVTIHTGTVFMTQPRSWTNYTITLQLLLCSVKEYWSLPLKDHAIWFHEIISVLWAKVRSVFENMT